MELVWKNGSDEVEDCFAIRKKVFMEEQGFSNEFDDIDHIAWHLLVREDGRPIATARLFAEGEGRIWHCGRICVLPEYRGGGIGLVIMRAMEQKALELGARELELSAQLQAAGFYERAGFIREGETYMDEHCPHVTMKKKLQ